MSSSKQRNNKHTTKFKEGGTDHREQNELSHNLRKEGTDHQKLRLLSNLVVSEMDISKRGNIRSYIFGMGK